LSEAKNSLLGYRALALDNNYKIAESLAFWESVSSADLFFDYQKKIEKITKKDILKAIDKYLKQPYTLVVIEPKK